MEYKADVVSASLAPVVWWGRQTSERDSQCSVAGAVMGEGWGPGVPGTGLSPSPVHSGKGGFPEEVTPAGT